MKLAVIGVGLIGGSFALALKKAKAVSHVVGVGRSAANLKLALERGIVDSIAKDAGDADLVRVAAPVGQYAAIFASLSSSQAVITDAGSTKRDVVAAAQMAQLMRQYGIPLRFRQPRHQADRQQHRRLEDTHQSRFQQRR
jgi:prephenate dehydrogenase